MIKIESSSSSNKRSKRIGTTITFVLAFSVAAFVASGVSYGAKPLPPTVLNATVCNKIGGVWASDTCTIPEGTSSVVSRDRTDSGLTISNGVTLKIQGSLTIDTGAIIVNSGTIIVKNAGGVISSTPLNDWETGILVLGTLDNSGAITIENAYDETNPIPQGTEGITVSVSVTQTDPQVPPNWYDPSTFVVVPGTLKNSGTITIRNGYKTRGIENLGTIANSASGTITVANTGTSSVGIYNRRFDLSSQFYINGTMTNAGSITISSSGDSNSGSQYGYGIYNNGHFTNSGIFAIGPNEQLDDGRGFYNSGTFTNYRTFTNNRGSYSTDLETVTWGSYNVAPGTMINYGVTSVGAREPYSPTGTFYNEMIMLNFGEITSYGWFHDETYLMINYGTFYNFGTIDRGTNQGICIDKDDGSGC